MPRLLLAQRGSGLAEPRRVTSKCCPISSAVNSRHRVGVQMCTPVHRQISQPEAPTPAKLQCSGTQQRCNTLVLNHQVGKELLGRAGATRGRGVAYSHKSVPRCCHSLCIIAALGRVQMCTGPPADHPDKPRVANGQPAASACRHPTLPRHCSNRMLAAQWLSDKQSTSKSQLLSQERCSVALGGPMCLFGYMWFGCTASGQPSGSRTTHKRCPLGIPCP